MNPPVASQIGQVPALMNIFNIINDICINAIKIKKELTEGNSGLSKVHKITPWCIPKKNGWNAVTGTLAYNVEFFIDYEEKSISQNKPPPDNRHTEPSRRDRSRQVRGLVFCDLCAQIESSFSQHQFHQLPAGSQYSLQITIESTNVASVSSTAVLKVASTILLRVHESYAGQ
jgi:hypothetical protein